MNLRIVRSTIALSATGLLLTSGLISAFAQTAPVAPPVAGSRMKMADELGLTATQKKQFMTLMKTNRQEKKSIESMAVTPDVKKAKLKDLEKSTRTSVASILTPAQIAKMKELRAEKKAESTGGTAPAVTAPGATAPKP